MFNVRAPNSAVKFNCIKEIFNTHDLTNDDKKYGITYICSLIDNISETSEFDNSFYRFLLYSNKLTYTGFFARCYNDFFDDAIKQKNEKIIKNMVLDINESVFFELFNNKLITDTDKIEILSIVNSELLALKSAIELAINKSDVITPILIGEKSLYYAEYVKLKFIETGIHISPLIQTQIYLTDKVAGCRTKNIFIFDLFTLLSEINVKNINPKTQGPFSTELYDAIKSKYEIELKLIARYLKSKQ